MMMVGVILLFLPDLRAQETRMSPAAADALKVKVAETAKATSTISCDFIQVKEMGMIAEKVTSSGKFWFRKERSLRWEYLRPFAYTIVIKDDKMSVKDENKVTDFNTQSNKVFSEINRIIIGCIRGTLLTEGKDFSAGYFESGAEWIVRLKPLNSTMKSSLEEIVIRFDRKDCTVSRLDMNEPGGDKTVITFNAKKINQPIPDEKFTVR